MFSPKYRIFYFIMKIIIFTIKRLNSNKKTKKILKLNNPPTDSSIILFNHCLNQKKLLNYLQEINNMKKNIKTNNLLKKSSQLQRKAAAFIDYFIIIQSIIHTCLIIIHGILSSIVIFPNHYFF